MLITLTTDFGDGSPYAAAMKGAIYAIHPAAGVVDLTHGLPPQDVRAGALFLEDVCPWYPTGTLHVAVVDPGVGSERALVYAEIGGRRYLAPDNGLVGRLAGRWPPVRIVRLTETRFFHKVVAPTFHGRDILAPVAARLALGLDPAELGPPHDRLVDLDWPQPSSRPGRIDGHALAVDRFGNVVTNIEPAAMAGREAATVAVAAPGGAAKKHAVARVRCYAERPAGALVLLVGSSGRLELAVVGGSAAARLGIAAGDAVSLIWPKAEKQP